MAAPKLPQQFGPYTLQELIARGGMAEIFRATMPGVGGFEKTVAIKKILPHLAENDEYMTMLIDEARIIVSINHANIAQVYDLGEIEGDYYIAMEYIHGVDLSTLIKELHDTNRTVPAEHALFIASGIAAGLHVAHNKCDDSGRPIHIVHRDVSPHNVLISFAGDVKIIDFGVAKARGKEAHTQLGVIKGKLLYMAPEQAMAKELDGRADLFAMGLILYRMLTNHLPFEGDNEFQIYNNILSKENPSPRAFTPGIREESNQLPMILLPRDPSKRYQDGYSAKVDLDRALQALAPGYSISRLSRWVESEFSHLIQQRQRSGSGQNDFPPSTPSHNQVHTGEIDSGGWDSQWDEIDENEDTVNVSMDSPEAQAVIRRAQEERDQYQELRASGALPAPAQAPWASPAQAPVHGQVPQPQQSGQWNQPQQVQQAPPPQFAGSGQWAAAPQNPYGSGQYAQPNPSGQWSQPPNPSGVFAPQPYPGQSGQFPAQQSGVFPPHQSGQFAAPSQSGVFAGPTPQGYYPPAGQSGVHNLPPSPHYETFQPGGDLSQQDVAAPPSRRLLPAVIVLLVLVALVGTLGWKLYVDGEPPSDGTNGAIAPENSTTAAAATNGAVPENVGVEVEVEVDAGSTAPRGEHGRTVRLLIDTTPKGADVFVGDKLLGQSPLDEFIPWGETEVKLRFELAGYQTKEMEAIPFGDVRRKVELRRSADDAADAGGAGGPDAGGADAGGADAGAPAVAEEPVKPKPKKKRRKKRRKTPPPPRKTDPTVPSKTDPTVPLLLDKPAPKPDVPVF